MLRSFPTGGGKFQTGTNPSHTAGVQAFPSDKGRDGTRTRKQVSRKRLRKHAVSGSYSCTTAGRMLKPRSHAARRHRKDRIPQRILKQLLDHRSGFERRNGTATVIEEVHMRIDSEYLEHRVMNVRRGDRSILRDFSQAVG